MFMSGFDVCWIVFQRYLVTYRIINSDCILYLFTDLSEEQRGYQDLALKFAREEIIPKASHYDKTGEVS